MVKILSTAIVSVGLSVLAGLALSAGHQAMAQGTRLPDRPAAPADYPVTPVVASLGAVSDQAPLRSLRPVARSVPAMAETVARDRAAPVHALPPAPRATRVSAPARPATALQPRMSGQQKQARKTLFLPYMIGIAR